MASTLVGPAPSIGFREWLAWERLRHWIDSISIRGRLSQRLRDHPKAPQQVVHFLVESLLRHILNWARQPGFVDDLERFDWEFVASLTAWMEMRNSSLQRSTANHLLFASGLMGIATPDSDVSCNVLTHHPPPFRIPSVS